MEGSRMESEVAPEQQPGITEAVLMAMWAHDGVEDRLGNPSILHALRVGASGKTEEEQIVGFLHDTLEDTNLKKIDIENTFGTKIADAVAFCTRIPNLETYEEYIYTLQTNPLSVLVKINDLKDNLRRLEELPKREQKSLGNRYRRALAFLQGDTEEF